MAEAPKDAAKEADKDAKAPGGAEEAAGGDAHDEKPKRKPPSMAMILLIVNFLAVGGALGMLVYTRFMYKRPSITEETERKRIADAIASPTPGAEPGKVDFEPITANIAETNGRKRYATIGFSLEIRDKSRSGDVETVRALLIDRFLAIVGKKQISEINQVQGRFVLRSEMIDAFNKVIFAKAGQLQAPTIAAAAAKPAAGGEGGEGGGEGGGHEGGEGGGEKKEGAAPAQPAAGAKTSSEPIRDLVTDVYFTQFIVQ